VAAAVAVAAATGHTVFNFDAHTPFLAGLGNLDLANLNLPYEEPEKCEHLNSKP